MPAITNKTITITCDTDGAEIRYEYQYGSGNAEDCPEPTNNSTLYTEPIVESGTQFIEAYVKAKAFKNGMIDSDIAGAHIQF